MLAGGFVVDFSGELVFESSLNLLAIYGSLLAVDYEEDLEPLFPLGGLGGA